MNTIRLAIAASVLALAAVPAGSAQAGARLCRTPYHHVTYRHVVRHVRYVRRDYGPRYGYSYGAAYEVPAIYGEALYDPVWSGPVVTRVYDDWGYEPRWYGYRGPSYVRYGGWDARGHGRWRHGDHDWDDHGHWDHGRHHGWR